MWRNCCSIGWCADHGPTRWHSASAGYGFAAIIVAFLGRLNPLGSLIAALALAVTYIGGENAQILLKLPKNAAFVFQGLLLFFLLSCDTLIHYRLRVRRVAGSA